MGTRAEFPRSKKPFFNAFREDKERLAARIVTGRFNALLAPLHGRVTTEDEVRDGIDLIKANIQSFNIEEAYRETLGHLENLLREKQYQDILKIYDNKGLLGKVSTIYGYKNRNHFLEQFKRILKSKEGGTLAEALKRQLPEIIELNI